MKAREVEVEIKIHKNPERAKHSQHFFKTGKGEYAEGDAFLGLSVPIQRSIAKKFKELPLSEVKKLLHSKVHEHRFVALEMLVFKFEKAEIKEREEIVSFYLKNTEYINNWDLVDTSAPYILGEWLLDKDKSVLYTLANSPVLWDKRIAVLSTFPFIKNGEYGDTLKLAEILLYDDHDLIHKAVGWMLREVGKKTEKALETFLIKNHKEMPRTMLRYAIEKLPPKKRAKYMKR